jgi:demethylmenaquinone methyltransferase/2-methoxy-6-polyprenyl-1,4-benzoquinol methylase
MSDVQDIFDPTYVKGVFDRCSSRYIGFSYFFSFGFTERWRSQCVEFMPQPASDGLVGYDLMAGTGEVWPHLLRRFPSIGAITAVDISSGMHAQAIKRLHSHRAYKIAFVEDNILASALPADTADFVVATFGLKTFNEMQHRELAKLVARVLKPGGAFAFVEASDPKDWWLRPLYRFHLRVVLPFIERTVLRGAQDFAMIGTYCDAFGDARGFGVALTEEGLEVEFRRFFFGCASGVFGRKPC